MLEDKGEEDRQGVLFQLSLEMGNPPAHTTPSERLMAREMEETAEHRVRVIRLDRLARKTSPRK